MFLYLIFFSVGITPIIKTKNLLLKLNIIASASEQLLSMGLSGVLVPVWD